MQNPAVRALAWKSRYLVVGFPAGIPNPTEPDVAERLADSLVFLGRAIRHVEPQRYMPEHGDLFPHCCDCQIKPRISPAFPWRKAADA